MSSAVHKGSVFQLLDSGATTDFGAALARCVPVESVIYLRGELGAGKSTLVRGFIHALGHIGPVTSPTYTLVEPYVLRDRHLFHFDLYRLGEPQELEELGIRDYLSMGATLLVEWPQRGCGALPAATLEIDLEYHGVGRRLQMVAQNDPLNFSLGTCLSEYGCG